MRSRTTSRMILLRCTTALAIMTFPAIALAEEMTGWTDKQEARRIDQFAKLTPEHFADTIETKDDELEAAATLDTAKGYTSKGGFNDTVRADTFLRTVLNKQTGRTIHQVYAHLTYTGEWRTFRTATYATTRGPVGAPRAIIHHDVDCKYGTCVFTEDVAFEVPESLLRDLAQRANERPVRPWRFRLQAQSGLDWTDDLPPAEAAGLLAAVDKYREAHGLPTP